MHLNMLTQQMTEMLLSNENKSKHYRSEINVNELNSLFQSS